MNKNKLDKIRGMLSGVALGDALGVPFEFRMVNPKPKYDNYINSSVEFEVRFRFSSKSIKPASVSDDTMMTMALFASISGYNYDRIEVIGNYIDVVNTCAFIGRNTRRLFKGIKTIKGYENRFNNLTSDEKRNMQSNGSLMRASPLAISFSEESIREDCYVTNPNETNFYCNIVYLEVLNGLLEIDEPGDVKMHVTNVCRKY